ncbi:MAG: alpha/beta fold hydrolase [Planctomycetes bacterium]|nr:alpha/beta fold hydrolase [Planctomycetota bacterium]
MKRRPIGVLALLALLACLAGAAAQEGPPSPDGPSPPDGDTERIAPQVSALPSLRTTGWNVSIETEDGVLLGGSLLEPDEPPSGFVLLLHMLARDREDWRALAPALRDEGYGALALDLRGHGDSRTRRGEPYEFLNFLPGDFARLPLDVDAAASYLAPRALSDPSRLAVVGASVGAGAAIAWAAKHAGEVRALVLLSPRWEFRGLSVREAVGAASEVPALVLAGEEEEHLDQAREIAQALAAGNPASRLVEIPPVGRHEEHGTALLSGGERGTEVRDTILAWIRERLGSPPPAGE